MKNTPRSIADIKILHEASNLKAKGLFNQAIDVLQSLINAHPDFAAAHNNLGTIYYARGEWQAAAQAFQSAINLQAEYIDAYYNLGLSLGKLSRYHEALHAYEAVLALKPDHAGALFQAGCLYAERHDDLDAIRYFNKLADLHPFHLETQMNLAACLLRLGRLHDAKAHYLNAFSIAPTEKQMLFNLGVIEMQMGNAKAAIEYYLQAVKGHPDYYEAHHNLASAYLAVRHREAATLHFREALRLRPDNEAVRHLLSILEEDKWLTSSPSAYVQTLFDSYADHYEAHLQSLRYTVPSLFHQLLINAIGQGDASRNVLDLGCGTGLCGAWLKPYARSMTGVDISENMLGQASRKGCYQALIRAPIETFLKETSETYDLIVAADVLVYLGKLEEVMAGIRRILLPGGLFLFNLEISEEADYLMTSSGRFAHRKQYIDQLLAVNDLPVLRYQTGTLREQEHTPIAGHLYLVQVSSPHPLQTTQRPLP